MKQYQHLKTGGVYEVKEIHFIHAGLLEGMKWWGYTATDDIPADHWVVWYQNVETGKRWCRTADAFFDGRFKPLPPAPASAEGSRK